MLLVAWVHAFLHSCAAAKMLPGLLSLQKLSTLLPFLHVVAAEKLNGQLLPQLGTAATVAGLPGAPLRSRCTLRLGQLSPMTILIMLSASPGPWLRGGGQCVTRCAGWGLPSGMCCTGPSEHCQMREAEWIHVAGILSGRRSGGRQPVDRRWMREVGRPGSPHSA